MTAIERKENTEKLLKTLGITLHDVLPPMEEEDLVTLKTPQEIAARILILTYLGCFATDKSLSQRVIDFLKQEGLWESASAVEKELFEKPELTEEESANIAWRGESIWLLLWIINKIDTLDLPVNQVDPRDVFDLLPGFMENTGDFINAATIRPLPEILDQADLTFRLCWALREASLDGTNNIAVNESIAYERHFAMNWVTFLSPQWDDAD